MALGMMLKIFRWLIPALMNDKESTGSYTSLCVIDNALE
jgi:hypothetical protein